MYCIGLMSGTSMDAIDVALVQFMNDRARLVAYRQYPYEESLRQRIWAVTDRLTIGEMSELDTQLGELFARATTSLLQDTGMDASAISAIGSHGQTLLHMPERHTPRTLQIGNPAVIAARTGITTIADFRRSDLAVGGQGAPLAPLFHAAQFRHPDEDRVVLNLGGMANITLLPADLTLAVSGFDTGPGNALMDGWIQSCRGLAYDEDGEWARTGQVDDRLLESLLAEAYFHRPPPKSTGKDDFNLAWLREHLSRCTHPVSDVDIQATLLELTAVTVSQAIAGHAVSTSEVLICGGGVHNPALLQRLGELLPGHRLMTTANIGIDPDAVEAVVFAWLARCRLENRPLPTPSITGADHYPVLGAVYLPPVG